MADNKLVSESPLPGAYSVRTVQIGGVDYPVVIVADGSGNTGNIVSTSNVRTTALLATQTYTGTGESILNYAEIDVNLAGSPQVCPGTLYFEFSPDNTNWDVSVPIAVDDLNVFIPYPLDTILPYFRVRYVNGAVNQSAFRLTVLLKPRAGASLARTLSQVIGRNDPVVCTRALIEPSPLGQGGLLGADREVFGMAIAASRITTFSADFSTALANNRVTSTVTGTGATAQASGQATASTGVGILGASARLESVRTLSHRPGRELFAIFGCRFTTPTLGTQSQRAGVYDDNNGFFLGYNGTTFGFTVRTGGSDTFTALTAANGDPLNATFLSRFTRSSRLETFDPTKLNIYRIHFGWGSSIQHFDIQSPDGVWMRVHSNLYPNLQTTPSIQSPALPIRMEVIKAVADATNLVIGTGVWAAGFVGDPYGLEPYEVFSREEVHANATLTGTAVASAVQVYTCNIGRQFRMCDVTMTAFLKTNNGGELQLQDGTSGTANPIVYRINLNQTLNTEQDFSHSFKAPPKFTSGVRLVFTVGQLASVATTVVDGYEDSI